MRQLEIIIQALAVGGTIVSGVIAFLTYWKAHLAEMRQKKGRVSAGEHDIIVEEAVRAAGFDDLTDQKETET
jgi:hypothetical protein